MEALNNIKKTIQMILEKSNLSESDKVTIIELLELYGRYSETNGEIKQLKAQIKAQSDMVKMQVDAQKAIAQDDRERDKMDQDLLVESAKILGQYGTKVDVESIKQSQQQARYPDARPSEAVSGGRF